MTGASAGLLLFLAGALSLGGCVQPDEDVLLYEEGDLHFHATLAQQSVASLADGSVNITLQSLVDHDLVVHDFYDSCGIFARFVVIDDGGREWKATQSGCYDGVGYTSTLVVPANAKAELTTSLGWDFVRENRTRSATEFPEGVYRVHVILITLDMLADAGKLEVR